jgi:hypothetical protein
MDEKQRRTTECPCSQAKKKPIMFHKSAIKHLPGSREDVFIIKDGSPRGSVFL